MTLHHPAQQPRLAAAARPKGGAVRDSVLNDSSLGTAGKIETLHLATLSRKPTPQEAQRFVKYVDEGNSNKDAKLALADLYWALLNSAEFNLNHGVKNGIESKPIDRRRIVPPSAADSCGR